MSATEDPKYIGSLLETHFKNVESFLEKQKLEEVIQSIRLLKETALEKLRKLSPSPFKALKLWKPKIAEQESPYGIYITCRMLLRRELAEAGIDVFLIPS